VVPGDRIGVVGQNGVGKSTLLLAASGQLAEASHAMADDEPKAVERL